MLSKEDLQAIRGVMKEELADSENLVLKEIERVQTNLETKIGQITKNLEELSQYYRISKLEYDNYNLLIKMISNLQAEVDELKSKIA